MFRAYIVQNKRTRIKRKGERVADLERAGEKTLTYKIFVYVKENKKLKFIDAYIYILIKHTYTNRLRGIKSESTKVDYSNGIQFCLKKGKKRILSFI
jgi:ABC-type transporter MlaC component